MRRSFPLWYCLGASLLLFGCVTNKTWKPGTSALSEPHDKSYKMVTIEFGEQGNYKDSSQLGLALKQIQETPRPLLVVYIHGWHNDARNADSFAALLTELGQSQHVLASHRPVIGVYLAWRGEVLSIPYINSVTFWDRYSAGAKLGSGYDCFDALAATVNAARKRDGATILIGHSFGGLVLQQAIAHSIAEAARTGHAVAPADLTLLINPASDSELTREIIESLRGTIGVAGNSQAKIPAIVSMTSETDNATKLAFPLGKYPNSVTKTFDHFQIEGRPKPLSGRYFYTHTPGHNKFLLSHETALIGNTNGTQANAFEENLERRVDPDDPQFRTLDETAGVWKLWKFNTIGTTQTPYWVLAVDKSIIPNHTDIFGVNARAMMAAIYRLNHPLASAAPVTFIKKSVVKEKLQLQAPAVRGQSVIPSTKHLLQQQNVSSPVGP